MALQGFGMILHGVGMALYGGNIVLAWFWHGVRMILAWPCKVLA